MAISAEVRAVYNAYVRLAEEATDPNEQEKFYQLAYDSIQEGFVPPVENSPVPPQVAAAAPSVRESTDELRRRLGLLSPDADIGRQDDEPGLEPVNPDLEFYDWLSRQHKQSIVDKVSLSARLQSIVDKGPPKFSLSNALTTAANAKNPAGLLVSGVITAFQQANDRRNFNYAKRAIEIDKKTNAQRANTIGDVTVEGINDLKTLAKMGLGGATTANITARPTTGLAYSESGVGPPLTDVQKADPYIDTPNLFSDLRKQISGFPTLGNTPFVASNIEQMVNPPQPKLLSTTPDLKDREPPMPGTSRNLVELEENRANFGDGLLSPKNVLDPDTGRVVFGNEADELVNRMVHRIRAENEAGPSYGGVYDTSPIDKYNEAQPDLRW